MYRLIYIKLGLVEAIHIPCQDPQSWLAAPLRTGGGHGKGGPGKLLLGPGCGNRSSLGWGAQEAADRAGFGSSSWPAAHGGWGLR